MQLVSLLALATIAVHSTIAGTLQELLVLEPELAGYNDLFKVNPKVLDALASAKNVTLFLSNTDTFKKPFNAKLVEALKKVPDELNTLAAAISANGSFPTSSFAGKGKIIRTNLVGPPGVTNMTDGSPIKAQNNIITSGRYTRAKITKANIPYDNGLVQIIDELIFEPAPIALTSLFIKDVGLAVAELFTTVNGQRQPLRPRETFISYTSKAWLQFSALSLFKSPDFLTTIAKYEIINSTIVYGPEVPDEGLSVPTLLGTPVNFTTNAKGKLFINGIPTAKQDILINNGVLHLLDQLLIPPGLDATIPDIRNPFPSSLPSPS